jgi:hypothetical protein
MALHIYRALLALPRFARHSLYHNKYWRIWFTVRYEYWGFYSTSSSSQWTLNGMLHREEVDKVTGDILPAYTGPYSTLYYLHGERIVGVERRINNKNAKIFAMY